MQLLNPMTHVLARDRKDKRYTRGRRGDRGGDWKLAVTVKEDRTYGCEAEAS